MTLIFKGVSSICVLVLIIHTGESNGDPSPSAKALRSPVSKTNSHPNKLFKASKSILSPPISKPPTDKRFYRGLTLSNDMKVILVSDPTTTKSAASLAIPAGSMSDPKELPGLAHFCEHCVFLGNSKYSEENGFLKYLAANGGDRNAATDHDSTVYYFTVSPNALEGALDRFSQLFISPLFTESALEREVNAVNSEHEKGIPSDARRADRVETVVSDPSHAYSNFRTGNRDTLWNIPREKGIDIRKAVMEFHEKYYSANIMTLAIIGRESLDELQDLTERIFLEVPNRNATMPSWPISPYGTEYLRKRIELVPIKDVRSIAINFPIPYDAVDYKSSSSEYLSVLIGHEGQGSLLSLLKNKNWATSLTAGPNIPYRGFATFQVSMGLTMEGYNNTESVICHVFEYIRHLQEKGPQKWFWEEIRDINAISYRFKEKSSVVSLVSRLSQNMMKYPIPDVLSAGYILTNYNEKYIKEILDSLVPENSRVMIVAKELEANANITEHYYGAKYNVEQISTQRIEKWKTCQNGTHEALTFPTRNEFIPTVFDLKPRDDNIGVVPKIINDTDLSRVWFLQDNEFFVPKAIVNVELFSPYAYVDPLSTALNYVFVHLITDALSEYSFNADLAGFSYGVVNTVYGMDVRVSGYNHKLDLLLNKVFEAISHFEVDPGRFEQAKDLHIRLWRSRRNEEPSKQSNTFFKYIMRERTWSSEELLNVFKDVTIERLQIFSKDFISRLRFQWLFYGNLSPEEALQMAEDSQAHFIKMGTQPLIPTQIMRLREIELPSGSNWIYKGETMTHSSSCASVLFQTGMQSPRQNVLIELLNQLAYEPSYNQLRTKEQLGYVVGTGVRRARGTQGFQILVQGDKHPAFVETRIDNFLNDFGIFLRNMTEEQFLKQRKAFADQKSHKVKSIAERHGILWSEISLEQYNFKRQEMEVLELDGVTLPEFVEFYEKYIGPGSDKRRRFTVHIVSMKDNGAGKIAKSSELPEYSEPREEIKVIQDFKKQRGLWPCMLSTQPQSFMK